MMLTMLALIGIGLSGMFSFHYFKRAIQDDFTLFALPACTWLALMIKLFICYFNI